MHVKSWAMKRTLPSSPQLEETTRVHRQRLLHTPMMEEARERREAELNFVEAAYSLEEAWCEESGKIFRRLTLADGDMHATVVLEMHMLPMYPMEQALEITGVVESASNPSIAKAAYEGLPNLLNSCRDIANALEGSEAVLSVFQHADDWVVDHWPTILAGLGQQQEQRGVVEDSKPSAVLVPSPVFGRRLIYSHHIIAKRKRTDLQALASEHKLTGFVKIGWPGLILIEGLEDDCQAFYDDIRRWSWQYLVVRGEMQEQMSPERTVNEYRRFKHGFREEDDMSVVAATCREVGLEDLFQTSMKVYPSRTQPFGPIEDGDDAYGALIQVDHMNDARSYRKWLRRTANEIDLLLMIKQCYPNGDETKLPFIFVGMVGRKKDVSNMLKRWRTTNVDVDSKGEPCLDRMITVLLEGYLERSVSGEVDSENSNSEVAVSQSPESILELSRLIGGDQWRGAVFDAIR